MFDTVSSVLSVFHKLIARLEKIKEKQVAKQNALQEERLSISAKIGDAQAEAQAAENAIAKLKTFVE